MADPDSSRPFVGRGPELAVLDLALVEVRRGRGECVLVTGEPGIGKTRLVREWLAGLPAGRVVWGRCHDGEGVPAYWPWTQALRALVRGVAPERLREWLGPGAADLARILPDVRRRLPDLPEPPALDAEPARFRLFDAVAGFLREVAGAEPLAVALDDLHWADSESLLLLRHVAADLVDAPVLLVGTCRDVELRQAAGAEQLLGALARLSRRMPLGGLPVEDVGRVAAAMAPGAVPAALVRRIHDATGGNPFFVEEVLELLRVERRLADAGAAAQEAFRMPAGVRDAIARRLAPLPPPTRSALEIAAVLGREADADLVGAALGVAPAEAFAALDPALAQGLLVRVPEHPARLRFPHALLQQTLLDVLPAARRVALHRRIGELLEARHAADRDAVAGTLAQHFLAAADPDSLRRAARWARRAGDRAVARLGYEEAAGQYERALGALAAAGGDPGERLELLVACGDAQRWAGDEEGARAVLLEATRLARERGDGAQMARAALSLAAARAETGRPDLQLVDIFEEALALLGDAQPARRVSVLGALSRLLYFTPAVARRLALSAEAVALARRVDEPEVLAGALIDRHMALWTAGNVTERLAIATEAVACAGHAGNVELECEARMWRIMDLLESAALPAARQELARFARRGEEMRLPRVEWTAALIDAALLLLAGDVPAAEARTLAAGQGRRGTSGNNVAQFFALQMFHVRRAQGRLDELDAAMQATVGQYGVLPIWRCGLALLHAELGRPEAARALLDELTAHGLEDFPRDGNWLPALATLADVAATLDDARTGALVLPHLAAHADETLVIATAAVVQGSVHRFAALAALAAGRLDEAVAHGEAALAANAALGARLELVRTRHALAVALGRRGAPGDAARAAALAAEAARDAAALGVAAPGPAPAAPARPPAAPAAEGPSRAAPATATLRREGDVWTLACGAELVRLRDVKGLVYLAQLLRHPGREFHVVDLAGGAPGEGDAGEVLDATARAAYRRRLEDLEDALEEAERFNDVDRAAGLREEREALAAELSRAVGLGGRSRRAGSHAERARLNVTRAIGTVVRKVAAECPVLGRHLQTSVRTGTFVAYEPDPGWPLDWRIDDGGAGGR